ncbi:MAG TPA: hypothetical protein PLC79_01730 [Phycisphaerae bacterium]|nr:hypothetical protein [Phycisphaerae bacterium]
MDLTPEERARAVHQLFQDNPGAGGTLLKVLMLFAAIPLVLAILYRLQQRAQGDRARQPVRLLWQLGRAASLGWWDRLLLIRMTRQARMKEPAVVLLSANCFDRAMAVWLRDSRGEGASRLQYIRRRLFGG